jgi:hypothetical protein
MDVGASKGIVTTTSRFAPGAYKEFEPLMPGRLTLRDGACPPQVATERESLIAPAKRQYLWLLLKGHFLANLVGTLLRTILIDQARHRCMV